MHSEQSIPKSRALVTQFTISVENSKVSHADSIFWTVLVNKADYYPCMMVGVAKQS